MKVGRSEAILGFLAVAVIVLALIIFIAHVRTEKAQQEDCEIYLNGRYVGDADGNTDFCVNQQGLVIRTYD